MNQFTLRDMLAQESLGLRLVTEPTPEALDRVVMGAHGTEALHPVPWLQRDWALLITGVRLVGSPERQRTLVAELADGGLAALGFGVGIDFDTVPEAIVEEAGRRNFPVFEIPLRTPFREIVAFVNRSLLSNDLHVMRRLTSMREFMLDALREDDPQTLIVQRLGSLLDSRVALFSADGRLEAQAGGDGEADGLWDAVRRSRSEAPTREGPQPQDGRGDFEIDGRPVLVAPVIDRDPPHPWLAVALTRQRSSESYARPLIQTAALLLGGLAGVRRVKRSLERATQAAFVGDLLDDAGAADSAAAHRAAALGLDLRAPARGLMIAPRESQALEDVLSLAEQELSGAGLPAVLSEREGRVAGFVQVTGEAELEAALGRLAGAPHGLAVGVGRSVTSVERLRTSLFDAQLALRPPLRARRPKPGLHRFEDFDLVTWLAVSADRADLREKARDTFGDLLEDDVLMPTLETFLDHRLNVSRSAKVLRLHPNSLRYRLARIEERIGRPLDDPDTLAALQLARRALDR